MEDKSLLQLVFKFSSKGSNAYVVHSQDTTSTDTVQSGAQLKLFFVKISFKLTTITMSSYSYSYSFTFILICLSLISSHSNHLCFINNNVFQLADTLKWSMYSMTSIIKIIMFT